MNPTPIPLPSTPGDVLKTGLTAATGSDSIRGSSFVAGLTVLIVIFLVWIVSAWIAGKARQQGHGWGWVFAVGVLGTPVFSTFIMAAFPDTYHADEKVECPSCSTRIRFNASKCSACAQALTPNLKIGTEIVNDFARWTARLKWAPLTVSIIGVISVIILYVQSDADFLTKSLPWNYPAFIVTGIGAALWLIIPMRKRAADELYYELVGNK